MKRRVFRFPWRTRAQVKTDVDDELTFHLEMRAREMEDHGVPPHVAREEAEREFGDVELTRQYCETVDQGAERSVRRMELMHDFQQDVAYAWRMLRRSPGFTVIAALTLALGIGANTAIFSVVNAVLLRSLPFDDADQVVRVISTRKGKNSAMSYLDFVDYRAQTKSLSGLSAISVDPHNLTGTDAAPLRVSGGTSSANLFSVMGARAALGRAFAPGDDAPGAPKTVVLGDALWRGRFNADRGIIGRVIALDGVPHVVIGVMPKGIEYPAGLDLWTALMPGPGELDPDGRGSHSLEAVGRLKSGVPVDQAERELMALGRQLETTYPLTNVGRGIRVTTVRDYIVGPIQKPLLILLGAVGFVLLIACANVANLFLVRASARGSEIAIRTALGAGRPRLVRQLVTESLLLAMIGGAAGVALAAWGTAALVRLGPDSIPRLSDVGLDAGVLAFTALVTLATGFLFGLLPAMHATTTDLAGALRAGSRGTRTRPGSRRARNTIVVSEVALAVMLLSGAGLLIRSFAHLLSVDPGFRADHLATFSIALPQAKYPTSENARVFVRRLEEKMRALPGAQSAAVVVGRPLGEWDASTSYVVAGRPLLPQGQRPSVHIRVTTADYIKTMGIRLVKGRTFSDADRRESQHVVLVNESMAKRDFPGADPIGKTIKLGWDSDEDGTMGGEIVGIVGDIKQYGLASSDEAQVLIPFEQWPISELHVMVRSSAPPLTVFAAARAAVREIDPDLPLDAPMTMEAAVASSVARPRFYAMLLGIFATVALVLAAVGLYGVISYAVSQRTHEIGIRIALGASRDRVLRMVVGQGLGLTVIGVVVGVGLAAAVTRVLSSLLFGISATDPATFATVGTVLLLVAALASAIPARRATRVDPVAALRD
ncbi:MAG: ABC transporter permease [Gemmatimonadaceae bacterium]